MPFATLARTGALALLCVLFLGLTAGPSGAVTLFVDTDPVPYSGNLTKKKVISGEVDLISVDSTRIELQIFVDGSAPQRFGVLAVHPDDTTHTPSLHGTAVDLLEGADVESSFVVGDEAIFALGDFPKQAKGVQKFSDILFVEYFGDELEAGDMLFFRFFDGGGKGGETDSVIVKTTIVPEPTTALLLGLGLAGLGALRSRARQRR